jgi:hypothetical protein
VYSLHLICLSYPYCLFNFRYQNHTTSSSSRVDISDNQTINTNVNSWIPLINSISISLLEIRIRRMIHFCLLYLSSTQNIPKLMRVHSVLKSFSGLQYQTIKIFCKFLKTMNILLIFSLIQMILPKASMIKMLYSFQNIVSIWNPFSQWMIKQKIHT